MTWPPSPISMTRHSVDAFIPFAGSFLSHSRMPSTCALSCLSCAVISRHQKVGVLVLLKESAMGSKRLLSNASIPPTPSIDNSKTPRRSKYLSQCSVTKRESVNIQRDDQEQIEAMTVQQLRTKLRNAGLPTKGRKEDLVSAFKCFLDNEVAGLNSQATGEQIPSEIKSKCTKNVLSKRKVMKTSCGDQKIDTSEGPGLQRTKRRTKEKAVERDLVQINAKVVQTKAKHPINTEESSGRKQSFNAKRKVSSEVGYEDMGPAVGKALVESPDEPWLTFAHKKPQKDWIAYNPKIMRPPPLSSDTMFVKLMSWNVNGLRALLKLEASSALQLAQREDFDVLCLQETKLQEKDVETFKECLIDGYDNSFWTCSLSKLGYSGTAIISRIKPISVRYGLGIADHDTEGRLVTAEFDKFYLLSAYVPNSGDGLKRLSYRVQQWDPSLSNYVKELEKSKPVILTGDLNCAHQEIDIYDPTGNKRSAGFTIEERESFGVNFLSRGFVDTFRKQHPGVVGYTYWGYRHGARKNNRAYSIIHLTKCETGWRLDYFLASESIADNVYDSYILPDITGSDHSPIGLVLKL